MRTSNPRLPNRFSRKLNHLRQPQAPEVSYERSRNGQRKPGKNFTINRKTSSENSFRVKSRSLRRTNLDPILQERQWSGEISEHV
jgi:hypothetical protein